MLTLQAPDYTSPTWESLPAAIRDEVRQWLNLFGQAPKTGLVKWMEDQATAMGLSYAAVRKKYYALRGANGSWTVLVDRRKAPVNPAEIALTGQAVFRNHLVKLVEQRQRNSKAGIRQLRRDWRDRKVIPGYEGWPGWPQMPAGWSDTRLGEIIRETVKREQLLSIRIGTSSKTNPMLPTVLTTRVGLQPMQYIQLDDMWHDSFFNVTVGRKQQPVRAIDLSALDVASAHRFHRGTMPRLRKADDSGFEGLKARDMRFFLAGLLHTHGYNPAGTAFLAEHATAAIPEDIERILYDSSGRRIRVMRQPLENVSALCGYWAGSEGGNFRAKVHLESLHNLIHNELSHLPLQAGKDAASRPVTTDRQLQYLASIQRRVEKIDPRRLNALRKPGIDFYDVFLPLYDLLSHEIAIRIDHDLEGWAELGHFVTEYTLQPGSEQFISEEEFLALEPEAQLVLRSVALKKPGWSRRRALSPLEVWDRRPKMQAIAPSIICDILTRDMAREVTARNSWLTVKDLELSNSARIYKAQFVSGPQRGERIGHGEKLLMFVNPFDDKRAFGIDAKGRYLGELELHQRILPINAAAFDTMADFANRPDLRSEALIAASRDKAQATAEILAPVRMRHADTVAEVQEMKAHNERLLNKAIPFTPEEHAEATATKRSARADKAASEEGDEALDLLAEAHARAADAEAEDDFEF